ncbi:Gfo/Idh/MocA family oxidoreductase [Ensifer sp. T173]|uniref:Gfo/Idh/MocA family oxidoreductase n=1 Tax=Ensifer canadensis TaxID=555315 RepID=A0AAW4FJE6_9HYPH|nr:Gfo/Idh/MocA family oxidoreductase [Ensifer canadensis]MBM3091161.1 Gfo/Idh/MocA family oxidoreductase [Ensifer canadensis]UBI78689.1 Gfo/Idh/MocA family oxidoreductase [Ensifer canadensis]
MLRWGILGTSFISDTMAGAISASDGSRIEAVAGRDPQRLSDFAGRHGIAKHYSGYDALLDDPDIDVVYIGLPNNMHHEAVIRAAEKGKAVLSEKSLTTTMAEADALAQAVRDRGIFFLEGLMYLCHPLMAKAGEILQSGRLGVIRSVSGLYAADIWKFVNPMGKGTIFNLGCYPASLLHYVIQTACGQHAFSSRSTSAFGNASSHDGNICDASLSVRFDNGVLATLQSTDSFGMSFAFSIHGERGALRFLTNPWLPVAGENRLELCEYGRAPEEIVVLSDHDAFGHQVRLVENCLKAGLKDAPRPAPQLTDSLEIMSLLSAWDDQARLSSTSGA